MSRYSPGSHYKSSNYQWEEQELAVIQPKDLLPPVVEEQQEKREDTVVNIAGKEEGSTHHHRLFFLLGFLLVLSVLLAAALTALASIKPQHQPAAGSIQLGTTILKPQSSTTPTVSSPTSSQQEVATESGTQSQEEGTSYFPLRDRAGSRLL